MGDMLTVSGASPCGCLLFGTIVCSAGFYQIMYECLIEVERTW